MVGVHTGGAGAVQRRGGGLQRRVGVQFYETGDCREVAREPVTFPQAD
jgi:hypothetical protein